MWILVWIIQAKTLKGIIFAIIWPKSGSDFAQKYPNREFKFIFLFQNDQKDKSFMPTNYVFLKLLN